MPDRQKSDRFSRLLQFIQRPWLLHAVFWILVFAMMMMTGPGNHTSRLEVIRKLIHLSFYMLVVYVNLGYLIPKFLSQKNFMTYVLMLLVMVAVFTPIDVMLLYFTFDEVDPREFLVMNQQYIFLLLFLIAIGSTVIRIISDWQRHQRDRKDLETQRMQSEIKFLKSQINPHFLFNTLNSLYALTLKKSDKAPEIVIKLSEMMRYTLKEAQLDLVPLESEINYITNYIDLQKVRFDNSVKFSFDLEGNFMENQIAPLLLIPFIENAFKHGVNSEQNSNIKITISIKGNVIHLQVFNNKVEIKNDAEEKSGLGIQNTKHRLELIYPDKYVLNIMDNKSVFSVSLKITLI